MAEVDTLKRSEVMLAQATVEKIAEDEMTEMLGWEAERFDRVRGGDVTREDLDELQAFVKFIAMLGRLGGLLSKVADEDAQPAMPVV